MPSERSERTSSQAVRRADGSKPGRRLVEEHELGVADEGDAEVEPALLAARERLHARVGLLARARRARSPRRRRAAPGSSRRTSGAPRAPTASAGAPSAGARRRCARDGRASPRHGSTPSTRHLAAVARPVALEDLDRRRLARAVRAEEAEHLAREHVEVDSAHGLDAVVRLPQARGRGSRLRRPRLGG